VITVKHISTFLLLILFASGVAGQEKRFAANWESLDSRPTPTWFLDAKFGVFIHWGVYAVPAWGMPQQYSEWYWNRLMSKEEKWAPWREFHRRNYGNQFDYSEFAPMFKAELYDAKQWASLFKRAGVKYVVPTSKHHDGFAIWPSAEASRNWGRPWNSMEVGPKRDLLGELATATKDEGLRFGFYYSLYEWYNPLWLSDRQRYVNEHMFPQFKDVVTRYQPSLIFSDGEWDMPTKDWRSEELLAWLFNESPSRSEVVINDRCGSESRHKHGGYWTTEYAAGLKDGSHPWEESRGMAYSYGLNRAERIDDYKTAREFVMTLIDIVCRGGNLLLDIGPDGDATIPPLMEERLLEIGDWLRVNGEAIYGTRPAPRTHQWTDGKRPKQEYGEFMVKYNLMEQLGQRSKNGMAVKQVFFTTKPGVLYAITAGWPGKELVIRDILVPTNAEVTMLGIPRKLKTVRGRNSLTIEAPDLDPDDAPCQYAYVFKIAGGVLEPEQDDQR